MPDTIVTIWIFFSLCNEIEILFLLIADCFNRFNAYTELTRNTFQQYRRSKLPIPYGIGFQRHFIHSKYALNENNNNNKKESKCIYKNNKIKLPRSYFVALFTNVMKFTVKTVEENFVQIFFFFFN